MIDAGTILEVTRNLIGATEPYGDSAIDRERTQNLDKLIYIVDELLYDVEKVAVNKALEAIEALPSAQQWIPCSEVTGERKEE